MQFVLIRDESGIQRAQECFRLLYVDCVPDITENTVAHAIAGDRDSTFLVVLQHKPPFTQSPVNREQFETKKCNLTAVVKALVVERKEGVRRLQYFLRHFLHSIHHHSTLFIGGPKTIIHTGPDVSLGDLMDALKRLGPRRPNPATKTS